MARIAALIDRLGGQRNSCARRFIEAPPIAEHYYAEAHAMKLVFTISLFLLGAGCTQVVDVTGAHDAEAGAPSDAQIPVADGDASPTTYDVAPRAFPECDPSTATPIAVQNQADLEQHLLGRWRQCTGSPLVGGPGQGTEFLADHTYFMLIRSGTDGALVRATGILSRGTWSTSDCAGSGNTFGCQLNVMLNGGGDGGRPSFATSPNQFVMETSAGAAGGPMLFGAVSP